MNYIWELFLEAENRKIDPASIHLQAESPCSAYYELAFSELNNDEVYENMVVPINPLYRYSSIFRKAMANDTLSKQELNTAIDQIIHFLYYLEKREQETKAEYCNRQMEREIECGIFGEKATGLFSLFSKEQKELVCSNLQFLYQSGEHIKVASNLIKELFPSSNIYYKNQSQCNLIVYIIEQKSVSISGKLEFIEYVFLPMFCTMEVYYDCHFGIIGLEHTMELGKLELC